MVGVALEEEAAELAKSTNYADASRYAEIKDELQGVNNKLKEQKAAFDVNQAAVKDNQKVIAYLSERGIDNEIIQFCLESGRVYESEFHHNTVFVGMDERGN